MKFEKKLDRLEEIVDKMESGDLSLDQSLKMFEEGIKL
ncbi:MAG: exodeoxyribonuclease VII small subunit, partial [Pseudomonadota bacterium]